MLVAFAWRLVEEKDVTVFLLRGRNGWTRTSEVSIASLARRQRGIT